MRVGAKIGIFVGALGLTALAAAQFYGYPNQPIPGQARIATSAAAAGVRVDQKLNDYIPLDATFTNQRGEKVTMRSILAGGRPVVIAPIFYNCPGICTDELNNLIRTFRGFKKDDIGTTFDFIALSIDSKETPDMAAAKRETFMDFYYRKGTEKGWHFLVGDDKNIRQVTDALGFQFTRDPANGAIVHPAGVMVLTPQGRISRYFLSTEYPARVMLDSIKEAGWGQVGIRDDRPFYLSCINIDPLTGQKSLNILNSLKTLGVATMVLLFGSIIWMTVRQRPGGSGGPGQAVS